MRILFLTAPTSNYVSDPLYVGLSRLLGHDKIIDYPYKPAYHDTDRKLWFLTQAPGRNYSREELIDLLAGQYFDFLCLSSFRKECMKEFEVLYSMVPCPPIVFIDEADDSRIRSEVPGRYPIQIYFKREFPWGKGCGIWEWVQRRWDFKGSKDLFMRTLPLPMSLVMETLPSVGIVKKKIDVSYAGRASHPRRPQAIEILTRMRDVSFSGALYASPEDRKYKLKAGRFQRLWTKIFNNRLVSDEEVAVKKGPETYYRQIAESKIAVSLRGGGWMTPRYFEIAAMGTMMLSERPEIIIPNDFGDRKQAVFCRNNLRDLEALVRFYLDHEDEREAIALAGRAHLLKFHTCERRAEYFLDTCRRLL